jgi:hypothetical protein
MRMDDKSQGERLGHNHLAIQLMKLRCRKEDVFDPLSAAAPTRLIEAPCPGG